MSAKRRKMKLTGVLAIILFLCVVVLATVILIRFLSFDNDVETEEPDEPEIVENETPEPEIEPEESDETVEPELPPVAEEIPEIYGNAPKPIYTQEEFLSLYPDTVLKSTEDAGDEYIDKIYFVGDSTTHGIKHYGVLKDGKDTAKVWTPRSGTLAMWNLLTEKVVLPDNDTEATIPEAVSYKKPEIMVLTLGVNGVSSCSKEQFVGYYEDLIAEIKKNSDETVIILQTIYPVCSDYQYVNSISMEKINTANSWIAEIANNNGCYFLNTVSVLVDETGYLNPSYSNGDGIHISPEGFSVILEYIRTHAYAK